MRLTPFKKIHSLIEPLIMQLNSTTLLFNLASTDTFPLPFCFSQVSLRSPKFQLTGVHSQKMHGEAFKFFGPRDPIQESIILISSLSLHASAFPFNMLYNEIQDRPYIDSSSNNPAMLLKIGARIIGKRMAMMMMLWGAAIWLRFGFTGVVFVS